MRFEGKRRETPGKRGAEKREEENMGGEEKKERWKGVIERQRWGN